MTVQDTLHAAPEQPGHRHPHRKGLKIFWIVVGVSLAVLALSIAVPFLIISKTAHTPATDVSGSQSPGVQQGTDAVPTSSGTPLDANGVPTRLADRIAGYKAVNSYIQESVSDRDGDVASEFVLKWSDLTNGGDPRYLWGLTDDPTGAVGEFISNHRLLSDSVVLEGPQAGTGPERTLTIPVSSNDLVSSTGPYDDVNLVVSLVYKNGVWLATGILYNSELYGTMP
jgi:hypothetical protein